MSNSVLNNKFKKWSSLLAQNPSNTNYKNKVSKYGSLLVRSTQNGGNGNDEKVEDLLRKIDTAVRKNMKGGKKITGYRNMRGGNGDIDAANATVADLEKNIQAQTDEINKLSQDYNNIIDDLLKKYIAESATNKNNIQKLEEAQAHIATLVQQNTNETAHNTLLTGLQTELTEQLAACKKENTLLDNSIAALKSRLEQLVGKTNSIVSALEQANSNKERIVQQIAEM